MKASAGKRVLMVVENNPFARDIRVRQEANALMQAGYRVAVICPSDSPGNWKQEVDGAWVYSYPAPPAGEGFISYIWEYLYSLAATFLLSVVVYVSHGFDIIHAANPPDTIVFVAAIYKLFGVRFIFDHHDLMPEMYQERFHGRGNGWVYRALMWTERVSCRMADHIIATNQSYKNMEITRHGIPEERITIVRNGPRLEKIKPIDPDPTLREKALIILGFVGVMAPQDGLDYLLRALQQLLCVLNRDDFHCIIIGTGSALAELKDLAKKLQLEAKVSFTGYIPELDKSRYLSTADICIDPDPSNAFNDRCTMIKMMEYMAMGKPIVAFDLPEHRVSAGEAALYAQPNSELDLARKIEILMDDPDKRAQMSAEGRRRVESDLHWNRQAEQLIRAYELLPDSRKT